MTDTQPYVVYPYDMEQRVAEKRRRHPNQTNPFDRQSKLLHIGLKLAKIGGFNDQFNIQSLDGTDYLPNTNIIKLINLSLQKVRNVAGISEWIHLLKKAGIDPSYILNENIKARLMELLGRNNSPPTGPAMRPASLGGPPPPPPPFPGSNNVDMQPQPSPTWSENRDDLENQDTTGAAAADDWSPVEAANLALPPTPENEREEVNWSPVGGGGDESPQPTRSPLMPKLDGPFYDDEAARDTPQMGPDYMSHDPNTRYEPYPRKSQRQRVWDIPK